MAVEKYLSNLMEQKLGMQPTEGQRELFNNLGEFLVSPPDDFPILIVRGYAGTGKTSLISALVRTMEQLERKTVLLAPTGRAAKVFSSYSGRSAHTIHKCIYRQKSIMDSSVFTLSENRMQNTLFIVDEASMISNENNVTTGSGGLLDDLIEFVYSGRGCSMLLLGDTAQLPPVGEVESPALTTSYLRSMFLDVTAVELKQVMRQLNDSGILYNATMLRQRIQEEDTYDPPQITFKGFDDISNVQGEELIEAIETSYNKAGMDETIILCRSNKRANVYNEGIRRRILYREEELSRGDMLMIVKNNYYWRDMLGKDEKALLEKLDFIANGDMAEIVRVHGTEEMYGFRFADVTLSLIDYEDCEIDVKIMLNTLTSESPSLTREENERLFNAVWEDYPEIRSKRKRMEEIRKNPYYNALQVKYGYAITCHKAQGGEWKHVFIDQGYISEEMINPDYYRWLYTAFTRASERLYLVNWKE